MMKKGKNGLALLLVVSMVLSMFTVTAIAKENEGCPQIDNNGNHKHDLMYVLEEATCAKEGLVTYYCGECGDGYKVDTEIIAKTEHDLEKVQLNKPSCTEKGNWVVRCKACGQEADHPTEPQLEADFRGQKWEPLGDGRHRMICKNCDGTPRGHSMVKDCRDDDEDGRCDDCGTELKKPCDQIDELGNHKLNKEVTPATCTEAGVVTWSCDKCGYYEKEELPPAGHKTVIMEECAPTCTEMGVEYEKCTVCGETVEKKESPALGHDWGEWRVVREATCTEAGEEKRECRREGCTASEEKEILAAGHKPQIEVDNAPTCTEKGNEHEECTACGAWLESKESPALGHVWGEWEVVKEATCTETGEAKRECRRKDCTAGEEKELPMADHKWGEQWAYGAETHWHACEVCGEKQSASENAHNFGEWVTVKEATTREEGLEKRVCRDCGYEQNRPIDKLGGRDPVIVTPDYYTLTVKYVDTEGNTVAPTVTRAGLESGDRYRVVSPEIEGYAADAALVEGVMTARNVEITVTYTAIEDEEETEELEDNNTPLAGLPEEESEELGDMDTPLAELPEEESEDLGDMDTPLAELPEMETEELPEEAVPMANVPQTGDSLWFWSMMTLCSAAGLVCLLPRKKQGKRVA